MARPTKNNCDYFSHDNNMRNHRKIKALRQNFSNGYAFWCMFLEFLTGSDGNVFENSQMELEMLSGDFGITVTEISDMLNFCISIELLFENNGFINSESLDERLYPVYKKRGIAKELSAKQKRCNGKFVTDITEPTEVSVTEKPQSKLNKTKVNYNKNILLSEIKISDVPEDLIPFYNIAISFQKLFISNLNEINLKNTSPEKAKFLDYVTPIRLMYKIDKRTDVELREIYTFLKKDIFWKKNILSTSKLREKFETLLIRSRENVNKPSINDDISDTPKDGYFYSPADGKHHKIISK